MRAALLLLCACSGGPKAPRSETGRDETGIHDSPAPETGDSENIDTSILDSTHETGGPSDSSDSSDSGEPVPVNLRSLGTFQARFLGEHTEDHVGNGHSFNAEHDLTGDGTPDLVIGAYGYDPGGAVYIVAGPFSGTSSLSAHDSVLRGEGAGVVVTTGQDLDEDGFMDLALSGPAANIGCTACGAVFLMVGPISGEDALLTDTADEAWTGALPSLYAGTSAVMSPDLTGDGAPDLIVGAAYTETSGDEAGRVFVVEPTLSGTSSLEDAAAVLNGDPDEGAGFATDAAGDFDGDGVADLVIGAYRDAAGFSFVVSGPVAGTSDLWDIGVVIGGEEDEDGLGYDVTALGDHDGDGYADVALAAPFNDYACRISGAAYLVLGLATPPPSLSASSADARWTGSCGDDDLGAMAGRSLEGPGDLDGDGLDELLIGASNLLTDAGRTGGAAVVYGPSAGTNALDDAGLILTGIAEGEEAGTGVGSAADADGDGLPDLLVGALSDATAGYDAGAVYLMSGIAR